MMVAKVILQGSLLPSLVSLSPHQLQVFVKSHGKVEGESCPPPPPKDKKDVD